MAPCEMLKLLRHGPEMIYCTEEIMVLITDWGGDVPGVGCTQEKVLDVLGVSTLCRVQVGFH